jgi:hypothetical protein
MEVKAAIASTSVLDQALGNIRSVKQLDRSNQGRNYVLNGRQRGDNVNLERWDHQVYGVIVTERSLSRDVLRDRLLDFVRTNPQRVWPNTYIDVHGPVVGYTAEEGPISSDATGRTDLWVDEPDRSVSGNALPLVFLAQHMLDLFRMAPIIDFWPSAYILLGPRFGDHWPISPPTAGQPVN